MLHLIIWGESPLIKTILTWFQLESFLNNNRRILENMESYFAAKIPNHLFNKEVPSRDRNTQTMRNVISGHCQLSPIGYCNSITLSALLSISTGQPATATTSQSPLFRLYQSLTHFNLKFSNVLLTMSKSLAKNRYVAIRNISCSFRFNISA